jgi:hypothetical protein
MLLFVWLGSSTNDPTIRFGYYGIAASFVISLLPAVEGIFGKKENPNELSVREKHLAKPLTDMNVWLSQGNDRLPDALNVFDHEIVKKGLLRMLEGDSPKLVKDLKDSESLVHELREGTVLNIHGVNAELLDRLNESERATNLVQEIEALIQKLLAKYGGF